MKTKKIFPGGTVWPIAHRLPDPVRIMWLNGSDPLMMLKSMIHSGWRGEQTWPVVIARHDSMKHDLVITKHDLVTTPDPWIFRAPIDLRLTGMRRHFWSLKRIFNDRIVL